MIRAENNYGKDVFNGDIGQIAKIDPLEREVVYDFGELDDVALAHAVTIHKSQGLEFAAVVIPLAMQQRSEINPGCGHHGGSPLPADRPKIPMPFRRP